MNQPGACVLVLAASCFTYQSTAAADITVASALAFRPILSELAPSFERMTGHKVTLVYGSAGAVRDRVRGGESMVRLERR